MEARSLPGQRCTEEPSTATRSHNAAPATLSLPFFLAESSVAFPPHPVCVDALPWLLTSVSATGSTEPLTARRVPDFTAPQTSEC